MADNQKLDLKHIPKTSGKPDRIVNEAKYWEKFKFPLLLKQYAAVTHIDFSPTAPHNFAIASSTRIQIFDPLTNEVKQTISRFKDTVYSPAFRQDGKLLVVGSEYPVVRLFETQKKTLLREFKGHNRAVHWTKFAPTNLNVFSGSDDTSLRYWDISTGQLVQSWAGHEDYIRAGAVHTSVPHLVVSGGYDHKLQVWDTRSPNTNPISSMNHGFPVEDMLLFPGGTLLASAGGDVIKIWDLLAGGRLVHTLKNHQKTVTSIQLTGDGTRLLSAGLDQLVKVYDTQDYSVLNTINYPAPILRMGISPDSTHLVVGMSDGMLSVRTRQLRLEDKLAARKQQQSQASAHLALKQKKSSHRLIDVKFIQERKARLAPYERRLSKFQYKEALDDAIGTNRPALIGISMIQELFRLSQIRFALSGRNENTILPVINFLINNLNNPNYTTVVLDTINELLDIYAPVVAKSEKFDAALQKLRIVVRDELFLQKNLVELAGSLEMMFALSGAHQAKEQASLAKISSVSINDDMNI